MKLSHPPRSLPLLPTQETRKKSLKQPSSKTSGKHPKQFVFDGDDELKSGMIKVAKLLKHALKISASVSTAISLDLVNIILCVCFVPPIITPTLLSQKSSTAGFYHSTPQMNIMFLPMFHR